MEKKMGPELRVLLERVTKFRKAYSHLKTNHAAQEELIKLQKIELEKANLRVEQLVKSGIECQKRFAASLSCLEAENKKLRASAENATRERDIARIEINEHLLESRRQNDEYVRKLEEDLGALRAKIDAQNKKHQEEIETIKNRHREEIYGYIEKLEALKSAKEAIVNKNNVPFTHPAFSNEPIIKPRRKKSTQTSAFRWPQLDISIKKDECRSPEISVQGKRKKLYCPDNDAVVDLTF